MPEEELEALQERVKFLEEEVNRIVRQSKYRFERDVELASGHNIITDTQTGMQIGTTSTQKIGFFGATPVAQQADIGTISEVGTDQDGAARAVINDIISVLDNMGFTAT
jgi:hypothetical protein